jgi:hypothetical protein
LLNNEGRMFELLVLSSWRVIVMSIGCSGEPIPLFLRCLKKQFSIPYTGKHVMKGLPLCLFLFAELLFMEYPRGHGSNFL